MSPPAPPAAPAAPELPYDYAEAAARVGFKQSDIEALRGEGGGPGEPAGASSVPRGLSDRQLALFYSACELDAARARRCMLQYYSCRRAAPEFFSDRRVDSEDVKASVEALEFSVLPAQSPEGYDVIFHRLHCTEPSKYHLDAGIKLLLMTVDACLYQRGPQAGIIFLFDMRGVKLTHLTRLSMGSLRKFFTYIQEAMPVRMKAIHIMNAVSFFDKILAVLRPFMDKKLLDMIKLHTSTEDLGVFYSTVLPRSALPPDYGGALPDTQTLHRQNIELLREMEPYFEQEEAQRTAALPRDKRTNGLARAFNNLEID